MHRLQIIKELEKLGYNKHGLIGLATDKLEFMLKHENETVLAKSKSDDEAFAPYVADFKKKVDKFGFESAFLMACGGHACGCMGPRDGDPYCHCEMVARTAKMFGHVAKNEGVHL